jgi:hypothetical protein
LIFLQKAQLKSAKLEILNLKKKINEKYRRNRSWNMGNGIAHTFAQTGFKVNLVDV